MRELCFVCYFGIVNLDIQKLVDRYKSPLDGKIVLELNSNWLSDKRLEK